MTSNSLVQTIAAGRMVTPARLANKGRTGSTGQDRRACRMLSLVPVALAVAFCADAAPARADAGVVQKLGGAAGPAKQLADSFGRDGTYVDQPNAAKVPFLGAVPTENMGGLFSKLDDLSGLAVAVTDATSIDALRQRLKGLSAVGVTDIETTCEGSPTCTKVSELTQLALTVGVKGSGSPAAKAFKSFGQDGSDTQHGGSGDDIVYGAAWTSTTPTATAAGSTW